MVRPDFIVGIIGNIVSIISFASSIGTFKKIVKKKSSENYKGVPYILTFLSSSLWTLYGLLDPAGLPIATVNGVGVVIETVFIVLFLIYASKKRRVKYIGYFVLDLVFIGTVFAITVMVFHGHSRQIFVGFLCATFTVGMYAAPLAAVRKVIRTRSVEYMPFLLSFSLFVSAGVWFTFAMLTKDYFVLVPNAVGILLGAFELILYFIYMNKSSSSKNVDTLVVEEEDEEEEKVDELLKNVEMKQDIEQGKF